MSNLQQHDQATTLSSINGDGNISYSKLGAVSATTSPLSLSATLTDQTLYENYSLKWEEALLEQKMAALKLETQKQLLNEFMLRKAQIQNVPLTCPAEIHLRTSKVPSQRNRELYKTALCDFWSAGIPCRFGERCWFAHGPHELRIARFVYPGLHPYDYEVRMNSANTLSSSYGRRFCNLEQNYPMVNAEVAPTTITPMGQNVPIGYERKLRRISPVQENMNSKNWRAAQRGISDGDSGIGSTGTNNSPEINVKCGTYFLRIVYLFLSFNQMYQEAPGTFQKENFDSTTYQFTPFHEPSLNSESKVVPQHLLRPLDTLTNRDQVNFLKGEAYSHWLNTGMVQSNGIQLPPGLEQGQPMNNVIRCASNRQLTKLKLDL
uniref:C3H1-type domain-containing protein n=1 Tax=Setaria digitata TaxID=48799 RepID=A0A915Q874_9BILA